MRGLLELLSAKIWTPHQAGAIALVAGGTVFTPPATEANVDGTTAYYRKYRFVRIIAIDGDVLVNVAANTAAAAPGTCSLRIFAGTSEIYQLPDNACSVNAASVAAGGCNAAIIWGR